MGEVASSADVPGYIDCFGKPSQRPTELSLKCVDDSTRLIGIVWDSWQQDSAEGHATLVSPDVEPRDVQVSLSSPIGESFTDLYVEGELAYP
ncbi:hypothetical protein CKALI_08015 [Corynebacterium kalinowskii]|uniref:Secreted protein n=1 Tax=Corynebacterium kalinowskii TaxID=2675216 RepID=A0A6B8VU43_9CORY|nr:hypothetical protein [Corynebacterium kalinowskii]QGU02465.1 hypothetical protein CKALI_08015 [Corynebacterium kalinowskii]